MRYLVGMYEGKDESEGGRLAASFEIDANDPKEAQAKVTEKFLNQRAPERTPATYYLKSIRLQPS